jgi:mitotic spindle assembly checkpoint protein MAD2
MCIAEWLMRGEIQKLIVVITGAESKDVLERWVFNVETDRSVRADG